MDLRCEPLREAHWGEVAKIYAEGIATGLATFASSVPSWEEWDAEHLAEPRLVALDGEAVVGWAALSPVSGRCVFGGVGEVSVYVAARARGRGVGKLLLERLALDSERAGLWTLQAGIFRENAASIALHRRCGFREVGVREKLGKLDGVWRDVVVLERRSRVVGL